jgi:hypothetical protein
MEDPEAYLRALTAPLARAREGSPLPVVRFSLEAVANAFVVLGLLPAARAGQILAAQRPVLEAAGFRVGVEIGELSVSPGARGFQQARAAAPASLRRIPLGVATGPVRCRLRSHGLVITSATLTPEGIWVRYHGDAGDSDDASARPVGKEVTGEITELSIADDTGGTYLVPAGGVHGHMSGRRLASGGTLWVPEGEFLAVPAPGGAGGRGSRAAARWLGFSAGSGQPARAEIPPFGPVPTGATQPPWPTQAECYLAQFAPPAADWSIGSFETGTVDLDTAAIVTGVAGVDGPYSVVLSADAYTAVSETSDHGYPLIEHIQRLLPGEIVWAPASSGAFVLTTRGGDFSLHLGQDVAIGYLSHTDSTVELYLQESLTFQMYTSEAAVALTPAG